MSKATEWRTIQVFLDEKTFSIIEVEVESESRELRCNCRYEATLSSPSCKHVKFVSRRMNSNNMYKVSIPDTVDEEELKEVMKSPEKFRAFIIKYGKVEVI